MNRSKLIARWVDLREHGDPAEDPIAYISGPMTGLPHFNMFSFLKAEKALHLAGWLTFNPVRNDLRLGIDLEGCSGLEKLEDLLPGHSFRKTMATDLYQVCMADVICVLPGWEHSTGANLEIDVAHRVEVPVYTFLHQRRIHAKA